MSRKVSILFMALILFIASACAAPMTNTEKGTAAGMGVGAATGAIVGGIAGNMIGNYMDKQEQELQRQVAGWQGTTVQRQQNNLAITMKSDVLFDTGSYTIKPGGLDGIARIAEILNRYPQTRITIEGHTDSPGSEQANMVLSEQRAKAVADELIARGVAPNRITTVGLGESRSIASNVTEGGRQLNRRVTLVIVPIEA
jgi:outer membrane protein OmpA-like peptidoglycan-associated protein